MKKVTWSAGHAMVTSGKETPDGQKEWTFNHQVVMAGMNYLSQFEDVIQLRLDDPTGQQDISLRERSNRANSWGTDLHVDVHHNTLGNSWRKEGTGIETYAMVGTAHYTESLRLAQIVHPKIVTAMELKDRGIKTKNLHMLRELNAPAILTEGGFMDSRFDISVLRDDAKLKAQGEAIASGIATFLKLKRKSNENKEDIRMFKPSTKTLENEMIKLLEQAFAKETLTSLEWVEKAKRGELPLDDAVGLLSAIIRRESLK